MDHLDDLGLRKRWIYEVVVSTWLDGAPHARPFGVWTEDGETLEMDACEGSRTLRAIVTGRHFVANFPGDATALAAALYDHGELVFRPAEQVAAPRLSGAAATVELILRRHEQGADRVRLLADPVHVRLEPGLRLINRAEGLLLESLVMASRLGLRDSAVIVAALRENHRVVHKVAPGSSYALAMDTLLRDTGASS